MLAIAGIEEGKSSSQSLFSTINTFVQFTIHILMGLFELFRSFVVSNTYFEDGTAGGAVMGGVDESELMSMFIPFPVFLSTIPFFPI